MTRICPKPKPWDKAYNHLKSFAEAHDCKPPFPPKLLILAGWVFSNDYEKKNRWEETVEWAESNGCLYLVDCIPDSDFYFVNEPSSYAEGTVYRPWDTESKKRPSSGVLEKSMETLVQQWPKIAGKKLSNITQPIKFTGKKARRLLVQADTMSQPPWGGWTHLSQVESERRAFTKFRALVNQAILPHEVDHIDFRVDEIAEQQTELNLVAGMMGTSEETTFLENMKKHEYLEFNRRNGWDNSDQFRAFKCNNLPYQIYFDLFDKHNVLVGKRNAAIIEKIIGSVSNPASWWGGGSYKYFELDDDKLNILFSFLSKSPATYAQGYVLGETTEKVGELMQSFDPQIIETIADVLKNSKTLLEIEEWQNFELDFSTPVEEQNEIFQKIKNNIDNFNDVMGIYAIFDSDTCLYIGKGKPIWGRIKSHYKAAKGLITNERWIGFFEQYQIILKIFWIEYNNLNEPTLDDKLRELFEHVLQMKYNPRFNSYR